MSIAETIRQQDYPDHVCPPGLERHGDARQGWHGTNAPAGDLMMVCEIGTACGCDVVGNGTLMHPVMIEPCAQHAAAMYPAFCAEQVVHIGFGHAASLDDGTPSQQFAFATLAEMNAFLLGIDSMDGWGDWSQFDDGPHYARNGEWWPE